MHIRRLEPLDRELIRALLTSDNTFHAEEVGVAMELVDASIQAPDGDYRILVAEELSVNGSVTAKIFGYVCYGPTPMTGGTYDLYWIATHRDARGRGVGTRLALAMEAELALLGARIVRIETSQLEAYGAARSFYSRLSYVEAGRIDDFYRPGDDLIILTKRLGVSALARDGRALRSTKDGAIF